MGQLDFEPVLPLAEQLHVGACDFEVNWLGRLESLEFNSQLQFFWDGPPRGHGFLPLPVLGHVHVSAVHEFEVWNHLPAVVEVPRLPLRRWRCLLPGMLRRLLERERAALLRGGRRFGPFLASWARLSSPLLLSRVGPDGLDPRLVLALLPPVGFGGDAVPSKQGGAQDLPGLLQSRLGDEVEQRLGPLGELPRVRVAHEVYRPALLGDEHALLPPEGERDGPPLPRCAPRPPRLARRRGRDLVRCAHVDVDWRAPRGRRQGGRLLPPS